MKKQFQKKAKKAYQLCLEAIEAADSDSVNDKWKKVYGRSFPTRVVPVTESAVARKAMTWSDTEEFIEDRYPVDIRYTLTLDCEVKQNGFRERTLRQMLAQKIPLLASKSLDFMIVEIDVPSDYSIEWKVLNRGDEARARNQIRGQIVAGEHTKTERTSFRGDHIVECYAIKNGVVVAKDRIHVPIATNM